MCKIFSYSIGKRKRNFCKPIKNYGFFDLITKKIFYFLLKKNSSIK